MNNNRSIEQILDKEGVTLLDILDEEDCIQELKNQNQRLLDFFDYNKCSEMIDYIVQLPQDDGDTKRCFKLPFISCELFVCEVAPFLEKFFQDPPDVEEPELSQPVLIAKIFSFLDGPHVKNYTLQGYFSKIVIAFICKVPSQLLGFLNQNKN